MPGTYKFTARFPAKRLERTPFLFLFVVLLAGASSRQAGTLRQAAEANHVLIGAAAASTHLAEPEYAAILGSEGGEVVQILHAAMLAGAPYTLLKGAVYIHPTLAEGLWTLMEAVTAV